MQPENKNLRPEWFFALLTRIMHYNGMAFPDPVKRAHLENVLTVRKECIGPYNFSFARY